MINKIRGFAKCKYCEGFADYKSFSEFEIHGINVYFCSPCQAEYLYWNIDNEFYTTNLYTTIDSKLYKWSTKMARLSLIQNPGQPGISINKNYVYLVKISGPNIPTITPSNIYDKVKTWLIFL